MLELVIRIVVLSTEKDSWVSCWWDEIRVTWVNEEEIRFVRFLGDSRGWGIEDLRNNGECRKWICIDEIEQQQDS